MLQIPRSQLITVFLGSCCVVGLLACGGSDPTTVVRAGDTVITKPEVAHWMSVMRGGRGLPAAATAQYRALRNQAVEFLIFSAWTTGEAHAEGIGLPDGEVRRQVATQRKQSFPDGGEAEFAEYLKQTGQTSADLTVEGRTALAIAKLRRALLARQPSVTRAEIVSYYRQHKQSFLVLEQRDIKVTNRKSVAAVEQLKREVRGGLPFAGLAQDATVKPNPNANLESKPDVDARLPIERAIFHARPHVLTGPIQGRVDYYLFEVTRIHPAVQRSLAEVSRTIQTKLNSERRAHSLALFSKAWSERWTAKTTCRPGYVVSKCREYKGDLSVTPLTDQSPLD